MATPIRGLWMGNRGCLHNATGRIVRDYQVTRWIICVLEFRGRQRAIMQPGHYTELFFLDEATALAAGHRPCAECQRARYNLYLDFWATTHGSTTRPRANDVDAELHATRWAYGRKVTYTARLGDLPDGTMIAALDDDAPYLLWQGQLWRWDFGGYAPAEASKACTEQSECDAGVPGAEVRVLTPRPMVEILAAGYPVHVHASLETGNSA